MSLKGKVSRVATIQAPRFQAAEHPANNHTPVCCYCQQSVDLLDDAICVIPGQWMPNRDVGEAMFVLEPDVQVQVMQLANGQMALMIGAELTMHAHQECHDQVRAEVLGDFGFMEEEDYGR